jgi:hypothetical protein
VRLGRKLGIGVVDQLKLFFLGISDGPFLQNYLSLLVGEVVFKLGVVAADELHDGLQLRLGGVALVEHRLFELSNRQKRLPWFHGLDHHSWVG